jgi:Spy/CpxP family protein refolding chaperone
MSRLLKIALIISLAFNITFVIGYFSAPSSAKTTELPEAAADLVQSELGLDMEQREQFVSLHAEARARTRDLIETMSIVRQQLLAESAEDEPDTEKIAKLQSELDRLRDEHRMCHQNLFRKFMDSLTDHQRHTVHEKLRYGRPPHWLRHQRLIREFDKDGDGRLNEEERGQAIQAVRERFHKRFRDRDHYHGPSRPDGRWPGHRPPKPGTWSPHKDGRPGREGPPRGKRGEEPSPEAPAERPEEEEEKTPT